MTYPYNYHEHKYYKNQYQGLMLYFDLEYDSKDVPADLLKYKEWLLERHNPNPVSILNYEYPYSFHSIHDQEDCRYPSEQFLISLADTVLQITAGKFRQVMKIVCDAWYDFGDDDFIQADEENLTYSLYTAGWSGNEDIIDALLSNISIRPALDVHWEGATVTLKYRLSDGKKKVKE